MVNGDTTEKPAYLVQDYVAEDEEGRYQHFDLKNLIVHISPNASETTAGDGDAAIAIEGTISLEFLNEGFNRPLGTGTDFPGIGIVAVLAAHGATLEKDDKPHTGTIYCTETLGGMDITVHSLHLVVEGTGNHFVLLLLGQSDEVNRIPADTDCELRVFLGMCLGVQQCFLGENVNVQMVTALLNIAVKQRNQIVDLILIGFHVESSLFVDVQGVHIDLGQPLHHRIVFFLLLSGKNGI